MHEPSPGSSWWTGWGSLGSLLQMQPPQLEWGGGPYPITSPPDPHRGGGGGGRAAPPALMLPVLLLSRPREQHPGGAGGDIGGPWHWGEGVVEEHRGRLCWDRASTRICCFLPAQPSLGGETEAWDWPVSLQWVRGSIRPALTLNHPPGKRAQESWPLVCAVSPWDGQVWHGLGLCPSSARGPG